MKEWICEEVPAVTIDGKVISTMLHQEQELVRCKDCRWAEVSNNEYTWCGHVDDGFCHENDWFCADGERKEGR